MCFLVSNIWGGYQSVLCVWHIYLGKFNVCSLYSFCGLCSLIVLSLRDIFFLLQCVEWMPIISIANCSFKYRAMCDYSFQIRVSEKGWWIAVLFFFLHILTNSLKMFVIQLRLDASNLSATQLYSWALFVRSWVEVPEKIIYPQCLLYCQHVLKMLTLKCLRGENVRNSKYLMYVSKAVFSFHW